MMAPMRGIIDWRPSPVATYIIDTVQDFLYKLDTKPHTYTFSGNKHFSLLKDCRNKSHFSALFFDLAPKSIHLV